MSLWQIGTNEMTMLCDYLLFCARKPYRIIKQAIRYTSRMCVWYHRLLNEELGILLAIYLYYYINIFYIFIGKVFVSSASIVVISFHLFVDTRVIFFFLFFFVFSFFVCLWFENIFISKQFYMLFHFNTNRHCCWI